MKTSYRLFKLAQIILISYISILTSHICSAQNVGMNSTGATPNSSAKLDLQTGNNYASPNGKGLLIPTASLTSTGDAVTVNTPATSLLVYNAATAGVSPNNVLPGFYYWNGIKWVAFEGPGSNNWALLGNAGTTASTAAIGAAVNNNFIGTTDNNSFVLATDNLERMRILNTGNIGIGITAPTSLFHIVDANSAFSTGTLATITGNALTTGNGLLIQSNSLTSGNLVNIQVTNAVATGPALNVSNAGQTGNAITAVGGGAVNYSAIFGSNAPTANGTGFDISTSSHAIAGQMNLAAPASNYAFAVLGEVLSHAEPCGGVMGVIAGETWGALAYHTVAGGATYYGGYFNTAIVNGGAGRMSNTGNQNNATSVGMGAYGDLFGGWVRGNVYGMAVKGDRVSLYVDGKTVVNQPITEVTRTVDNQTMVNYTSVSATPVLQINGTARMENGIAVVSIDEQTLSQYTNTEDLTIIATPSGQTNGVYAELRGRELSIKENNNGKSNTKVSWIIIGSRNIQNNTLPDEIKANDFDANLRSFMHNENDTYTPSTGLYWDGNKLNTGISPTAKGKH